MNNCQYLLDWSAKDGRRAFLIDGGEDIEHTYHQITAEVQKTASFLNALGIREGDIVCHHLHNSIDAVIVHMAIHYIGGVTCFLDPLLKPKGLAYYIDDTRSLFLITHLSIQSLTAHIPSYCNIIPIESSKRRIEASIPQQSTPHAFSKNDLCSLYYTSGTTGPPKGVMLSLGNISHSTRYLQDAFFKLQPDDRLICFVPFSHGFGSMTALLPTIISGAALIMMRSFHPRQVLDAINQYGGTHILGVPSHYQQLLRYGEAREALRKLKFAFCAAAPLKVSVAQAWWDVTRLILAEGYGCIETSTALSIRYSKIPDPMGEVGFHKSAFVNIRIKDESGNLRDTPGIRGEIVIKAPSVMMGYFNQPDATEKAIRRGWYHSGDLGYFKNDGSLVLAGRIKDVINIAGLKISPLEVESVLNRHPEVIESAVFGRDDDLYGEVVVACVKKRADSNLGDRHLIRHAGNYLQPFQVPRDIYFIDRFPRNTIGKIDKVELRKWVMARSGL